MYAAFAFASISFWLFCPITASRLFCWFVFSWLCSSVAACFDVSCKAFVIAADVPPVERIGTIKAATQIAPPSKGIPIPLKRLNSAITKPTPARIRPMMAVGIARSPRNGIQPTSSDNTPTTMAIMPIVSDAVFFVVTMIGWGSCGVIGEFINAGPITLFFSPAPSGGASP